MYIQVNGEPCSASDGSTVADLLDQLKIGRERVAVEVNQDIVPRASHGTHRLCEGDRIEIVQFVGGG